MKDYFKITGELKIHAVTKTATLEVWFRGTIVDDRSKKTKAGFQIKGAINRSDFNIGPAGPFDISLM